jgi:hypothetical protein
MGFGVCLDRGHGAHACSTHRADSMYGTEPKKRLTQTVRAQLTVLLDSRVRIEGGEHAGGVHHYI